MDISNELSIERLEELAFKVLLQLNKAYSFQYREQLNEAVKRGKSSITVNYQGTPTILFFDSKGQVINVVKNLKVKR